MLAARRLAFCAPLAARAPLLAARRLPPACAARPWSRALSTAPGGGSADGEAAAAEPKAEEPKAEEPKAEDRAAAAAAAAERGEEAAAPADGTANEAADAAADESADPLVTLEAKVGELEEQVKAKHEQVLRALAEAENARRRAALDVESAHKFAIGKFAKNLLEVADVLKLAADSVPEEQRVDTAQPVLKALYEGVVMTDTVLHKALESSGMKKVWPIDEKFDPNFHNALFEIPDPEKEPGTVAHVASAGYMLNERCIRAAGVGIVSKPA